jgi:dihydrofolate reductase
LSEVKEKQMAKLIYGMMQSLDGYVANAAGEITLPVPERALHQWFNERMAAVAGSIYGRRMYEMMSFWDGPDAEAADADFTRAYRASPKWVVSRTLETVGPNAVLLGSDLTAEVLTLKAEHDEDIEVAGPQLAAGLTELALIDEYWLYIMPVVLGGGKPAFTAPMPESMKLIGVEQLPQEVALVKYGRTS